MSPSPTPAAAAAAAAATTASTTRRPHLSSPLLLTSTTVTVLIASLSVLCNIVAIPYQPAAAAPSLKRRVVVNEPAAPGASGGPEAVTIGAYPSGNMITMSSAGANYTTDASTSQPAPAQLRQQHSAAEPFKIDPDQQVVAKAAQAPKSDRQSILEMYARFFTRARSHDDQQQKEYVREGVVRRMRELGFETSFLQKSRFEFRKRPAASYNMISILPGRHRQTKRDRIVLIGAHWDSATKAPGVDDNGSGSTCLLEIARLISANRCKFNHTVMFVWFDYEEQGKYGSEFFVNDYLFPLELDKYGSRFLGAYIMDMILVRDKEANTQTLPANLKSRLADFSDELERESNRGDFLATWSRRTHDEPLESTFRDAWVDLGYESRTFKSMRPDLPQGRLPNSYERYEWKDFFRSDHASFWYPQLTSPAVRRSPNRTLSIGHPSLNAILLTDLGPWRRSYARCYHSSCDDEHLLTDDNLAFMQQVTDALLLTLLRVGQGECGAGPPAPKTRSSALTSVSAPSSPSSSSVENSVALNEQLAALNSATSYVTIESPLPPIAPNNHEPAPPSLSLVSTTTTTTTTTTPATTPSAPPPTITTIAPESTSGQARSSLPTSSPPATTTLNLPPPTVVCNDNNKNCTDNNNNDLVKASVPNVAEEPCQEHNCISMAQAH